MEDNSITVRFYAGAAAAAGISEYQVPLGVLPRPDADTLGAAVPAAPASPPPGGESTVGEAPHEPRASLSQITQYLVGQFPALEPILPLCTFLSTHESRALDSGTGETVAPGDTIEVLPPFAGG